MIVKININHEENKTTIEKRKVTNVFIIENIFSKRKSHIEETYVNVQNDSEMIVTIIWQTEKSNPV